MVVEGLSYIIANLFAGSAGKFGLLQFPVMVSKINHCCKKVTILQFIPAFQDIGVLNGITDGWTTHPRQKISNIHLINQ